MNTNNPYKGLFPYLAEDEKFFFGRERETSDLVELIKNNQLVILYGESGTGKTSLIHAKLFPELNRQYYFPIYIRLDYSSKIPPLQQLRERMNEEFNIWYGERDFPLFSSEMTLVEFASQTKVFNGIVKPILFFDQFEELFTLAPRHIYSTDRTEFITQLSDLIEVNLPYHKKKAQKVIGTLESDEGDFLEDDEIGIATDEAENLEERERRKKISTQNILRFKVVFSLRQDYIAHLDDLRFQIPSISTTRYSLKKFSEKQAFAAITKPAEEYVKGVKNLQLIDELASQEIIRQLKELEVSEVNYTPPKESSLVNFLSEKNILKGFYSWLKRILRLNKAADGDDERKSLLTAEYVKEIRLDPTVLSLYCYQLYAKGEPVMPEPNRSVDEKLTEASEDKEKLKQGSENSETKYRRITLEEVHSTSGIIEIENYYRTELKDKIKIAVEKFLITRDGKRVTPPLLWFCKQAKLKVEDVEKISKETAILRIQGKGEESKIELAHDQIAKRALANKNSREAGRIRRNAIWLLFMCIIIVGLSTFSWFISLREREKRSDVVYLKKQIDDYINQTAQLRYENAFVEDSLSALQEKFSNVLANESGLVTSNKEVNERFKQLQDALIMEKSVRTNFENTAAQTVRENSLLRGQITALSARYEYSRDSLARTLTAAANETANSLGDRIKQLVDQNSKLENENSILEKMNKSLAQQKSTKKILWVDEDPKNKTFFVDNFSFPTAELKIAVTTKMAYDILRRDSIDVIVSDIDRGNEGDKVGIEFRREILKTRYKAIPFIFFSNKADDGDILKQISNLNVNFSSTNYAAVLEHINTILKKEEESHRQNNFQIQQQQQQQQRGKGKRKS